MSVPFDGFVLRKPRIAASNSPFTAEGDVFVRQQDRSTYLTNFVNNSSAPTTEYLVQVHETADLVVPSEITETAKKVSEWVYQFNSEGRAIESVSSVTPTPDSTDAQSGLVKYSSDPGQDVVVVWEPARLKINWTKNDERTRFGFDDRFQRWTPLPGGAPENLGTLPDTPNGQTPLALPVVEGGEPLVVIGTPDQNTGTVVPVPEANRLTDGQFQAYINGTSSVPSGEAVLNVDNGTVLFANDLVNTYLSQPVYFYRKNFFAYDASTGQIGHVGDALYMNPIPDATEVPRIRVKYRTYLRGEQSTSTTTPSTGYDFVWNPNTGAVHLDSSVEADFEGEAIYYDGVFSNADPIESYAHTNLGSIEDANPFTTAGLSDIDFTAYDHDSIILYVTETGEAIRDLEFVEDTGDFTDSLNLPSTKAQVVRSGTDAGKIQLSHTFRREKADNNYSLSVGTSDFPVEKGITFRMEQSPVDPTNNRGLPDGKGVSRVANEILSTSLPAGPSFLLNQLPLQDVAGYDDNVFYQLEQGAKRKILQPGLDVMYDFDNRQLQWAQQASHSSVIPSSSYSVQLPHQIIHNENYSFELNEGGGFVPLEPDDDVLINFDTGTITFIEDVGDVLFEDIGVLTNPDTLQAATANLSGLTVPSDSLRAPLLLVGEDAYRIVSTTANTVTVDRNIDLSGNITEFTIIEVPEIVFRYAMQSVDLRERTVFPYVVSDVDTHAPDGEALEFVSDGSVVPHILLEPETLGALGSTITLPAYYQASEANYRIFREGVELFFTTSSPNTGEYSLSGNTLVFNSTDEADNVGTDIILDPDLSSTRSTGPIEVLVSSRELNVPTDLQGTDLEVRALVPEDQYTLQGLVLFLDKPFRSGQRLFVRYTDSDGTEIEEDVGFRVVDTLGNVGSGASDTFGAGRTVDLQRPTQVLVNGARSALEINTTTKTVSLDSVRRGRRVQVSYYALDADGGETTVSLLERPMGSPVLFEEGSTQTFRGDHTDVLEADVFLQANDQSFTVLAAAYNSTTNETTVEVSPAATGALRNPNVLVSTTPITNTETVMVEVEDNSAGEQQLRLIGNFTDKISESKIIYLDDDPYYVQGAEFNENSGFTRVTLASALMQEYTDPTVVVSTYEVYAPETQILHASKFGIPERTVRLVRFDKTGNGSVLEKDFAYTFEAGGRIILEPTVTTPPNPEEVWYLAYTALREVGPRSIAGQTFLPRFKASYTRRVNATEDNGIKGAMLRASFDFSSPDTFYFRAVRMEEYAFEVAEEINSKARQSAPSGGPVLSTAQSQDLFKKGNEGLIFEGGNLRDQDRAGRVFLEFYNQIILKFEEVLEVIDGRVVGDRDSKFVFRLRNDNTPGGIDPVTGELIPFYANPQSPGTKPTPTEIANTKNLSSQMGAVENYIDDLVMVSKKPFKLEIGLPLDFKFQGTFRPVWKPSKFSRLYPEQKQSFSITVPQIDGDQEYEFPDDFLHILADPQQESILSLENVRKRAAKARVREGGTFSASTGDVRIHVAMEYDPVTGDFSNTTYDPTGPVPELYIPAFEVGDHVNLGRVTYSVSGGVIDQTTTLYGQNLIVAAVGADYIEVSTNPENGNSDFNDLTMTDATTLSPQKGDTIYTMPPVADSGFVLGESTPPYYRTPLDMFVNSSEGELINTTLPGFIAKLLGQSPISPGTFLDMTVNFRNQRTEPFRFPALDGGVVDDDGDQPPPFVTPFKDSEIQRLNAELVANQTVIDDTDGGTVIEGTLVDAVTLSVSTDLTAIANPPDEFDLVVADSITELGDSVEFDVGSIDPSNVRLASFVTPDTVNFTVEKLYEGTDGERDTVTTRWNDGTKDFTDFSGFDTMTLHVSDGAGGYSAYDVDSVFDGYLITSNPIAESGPTDYYLSLSDSGSIPATIDRINSTGIDFSDATGDVTVSGGGPNNGTSYTAKGGGPGFLHIETIPLSIGDQVVIGISNASVVASGTGSVDAAGSVMQTADSVANIEPGQTLIVGSSTVNGGRYKVSSVDDSGAVNTITIEETFYSPLGDSGLANYPMSWRVTRPRRFAPEIDALRDELVEQRVTYTLNSDAPVDIQPLLTATSGNPSTTLKERLTDLREVLFGPPILSVTGGDAVASVTGFEGADFVAEDIRQGDIVVVEEGINRGFYTVASIDDSVSPQQLIVFENNSYTTYVLSNEVGVDFDIYRSDVLQPRSNQLVLYEYFNVFEVIERIDDGIRMCTHDPLNLLGALGALTERPGDPADYTLLDHQSEVNDRFSWIRDASPDLRQEIVALLKGVEALYDIRYAWIDFRTNLEDGTLAKIERYKSNLAKRKRKRKRELTKLLSS